MILGCVVVVILIWGCGEIFVDVECIVVVFEGCVDDVFVSFEFVLIVLGDSIYLDFCGGGFCFVNLFKVYGVCEL